MTDGSTIDAGYVGVTAPATTVFTVAFKDWNGTVIAERQVNKGENAMPPANPSRDGYVFTGWDKSFTNVQSDLVVTAQYEKETPSATYYTVVFKDYDNSIISSQQVIEGGDAAAPADPVRSGYLFIGWSGSYTNVTANTAVIANYILETEPAFITDSVTVSPGATGVKVAIFIRNNPGILGMTLTVSYDESVLTMTGASNGSATNVLTLTKAKTLHSGCNFVWDGQELAPEDIEDGEVLVITFAVAAAAAPGEYPITVSYKPTDIVDAELNIVAPAICNGRITVTK